MAFIKGGNFSKKFNISIPEVGLTEFTATIRSLDSATIKCKPFKYKERMMEITVFVQASDYTSATGYLSVQIAHVGTEAITRTLTREAGLPFDDSGVTAAILQVWGTGPKFTKDGKS